MFIREQKSTHRVVALCKLHRTNVRFHLMTLMSLDRVFFRAGFLRIPRFGWGRKTSPKPAITTLIVQELYFGKFVVSRTMLVFISLLELIIPRRIHLRFSVGFWWVVKSIIVVLFRQNRAIRISLTKVTTKCSYSRFMLNQ